MTTRPAPARDQQPTPQLKRVLTFRDLFLYYSVTGFSLRWIATGAAAGPSALVIWVVAALGFFVPLVFSVLELSSRYPEEGGVYVWSKRAFGPFAAFITGWTYWGSNLPYFPGLLYFAAANVLYVGGPAWQSLANNSSYFVAVSLAGRQRLAIILLYVHRQQGVVHQCLNCASMFLMKSRILRRPEQRPPERRHRGPSRIRIS